MIAKFISFLNEQASKDSQEKNGHFGFKLKGAVQVVGVKCEKQLDIVFDSGKNEVSVFENILHLHHSCGGIEYVNKKNKKEKSV